MAELGASAYCGRLCVAHFGPTFTAVRLAVFLTILTGVALTDLKHYLIPDGFTVTGLLFMLATALARTIRRVTADCLPARTTRSSARAPARA